MLVDTEDQVRKVMSMFYLCEVLFFERIKISVIDIDQVTSVVKTFFFWYILKKILRILKTLFTNASLLTTIIRKKHYPTFGQHRKIIVSRYLK